MSDDGAEIEGLRPRTFTLRAIALGTVLSASVCALVPYNDYVVVNTFLVGSYLPLAFTLAVVLLVVVGNGLYRWCTPQRALQQGELALVLLMLGVACSVPSQGLFRGLLPSIVSPFWYGQTDPTFWQGFDAAHMPNWLYPVPSMADGPRSDEIRWFFGRVPDGHAIPYHAWLVPLMAWGVYAFGLMLALVSIATLTRIQWAQHERLPFPLAQFQLALIEPPEPGRVMNTLFCSRAFWIATSGVVLVHLLNGLHAYDARWPVIARMYDLRPVMGEEPWRYVPDTIRTAPIYFTFIGIAYFIRTRVTLSIWLIYVISQLYAAGRASATRDVPAGQWQDQHLGACIAFALGMFVIARRFLWGSLKSALGFAVDEASVSVNPGDRLVARWAARGILFGIVVLLAWFLTIGAAPLLAITTVAFILLAHVVTARVVAETGIPFVRMSPALSNVLTMLPATSVSARTAYLCGTFTLNGSFQTRESLAALSQQGLQTLEQSDHTPRTGRRFAGLAAIVAGTLLLAYVVSSWSHLTAYYSYATPLSPRLNRTVLNEDVLLVHTATSIRDPVIQHASGAFPARGYSPALHVGIGFAITAALQVMTWQVAGWPLLPVGYLMSATTFAGATWFSLMIGWLGKSLLLRAGGPRLLESARPLFIGLIFGEGLAAALWMVVSLVLASRGYDYRPYSALPT